MLKCKKTSVAGNLAVLDFLSDESGQATVEYVLILSFVVVVAGTISRTLMSTLDRSIGYLGAELEKQLRTGRLKVSAWNN